jgi:hypothetical protein
MGRGDEAAAAWQEALALLEAGVGDRAALEMKLQAMGADVPAAANGS